ncbi:LamB/YcsF family protein [Undibacterium sp. CY7W]|uniref:LamB/YcsF family protein n=1 Tax=Undibacterium rugosum TaxID=2762291 RepID=A0A923I2F3_9BURK|nr:5-oxoprolinase subunit PxpA [Undibacterium rugosum]MBC3934779.1 LamB/YcsF family protein [Undibacterium rugosum]
MAKDWDIDLNADLGEGCGDDEAILACVSSANIACGGHAGDADSMRTAVRAALKLGVKIGAHPSFEDRQNFGRSEMQLPAEIVYAQVYAQIRALQAICAEQGAECVHVKPHGALYNQAARDLALARVVVSAIRDAGAHLCVVGLAGSALITAAREAGMPFAQEAFADRRYNPDGSLMSRQLAAAVITDNAEALAQAKQMVAHHSVTAQDGSRLTLEVDTLCLHGDGAHALALARQLRAWLDAG